MELALLVLVLLALGGLALVLRTRGRIVIVWGERWPSGDDGGIAAARVSDRLHALAPPSPWEQELRRRLQRRLVALPPSTSSAAAPAAHAALPLDAAPVADGRYRLLPSPARRQE